MLPRVQPGLVWFAGAACQPNRPSKPCGTVSIISETRHGRWRAGGHRRGGPAQIVTPISPFYSACRRRWCRSEPVQKKCDNHTLAVFFLILSNFMENGDSYRPSPWQNASSQLVDGVNLEATTFSLLSFLNLVAHQLGMRVLTTLLWWPFQAVIIEVKNIFRYVLCCHGPAANWEIGE